MDDKLKQTLSDRFALELWPINKRGNHEYALNELLMACSRKITVEGNQVTFELIKAKYTEYVKFMKAINSEREQKFQSKIEDIGSFIAGDKFNENFELATNQTLDNYLYGI